MRQGILKHGPALARHFLAFGLAVLAGDAFAKPTPRYRVSASVGLFQAPLPSIYSFSLEYHFTRGLAAGAGYGFGTAEGENAGVGAYGVYGALYPMPTWLISPVFRVIVQKTRGFTRPTYEEEVVTPFGTSVVRGSTSGTSIWGEAALQVRVAQPVHAAFGYSQPLTDGTGRMPFLRLRFSF